MITIKDIAKRAGLSIAAVSYALNGKEGVSEETKQKVRDIAAEMGYIPNLLAKGLISKRTDILGLITPDVSNPYTANFIKYLDMYARESGYFLLLGSLTRDQENEAEVFEALIAKHVDGFIITPASDHETTYQEIAAALNKAGKPFLFVNVAFPGIKASYVVPDLEEGEYQLTLYLLQEGFKDFVFCGAKRTNYYADIRYRGFLRALREFGFNHDAAKYVVCGDAVGFAEGYQAVKEFGKKFRFPEVIIAQNDMMAYGIIKGLREYGLSVPRDIGVAGFDDLELPSFDTVPLTTVRIPVAAMAEQCIDIMNESNHNKMIRQLILPTEVVIRESVKR